MAPYGQINPEASTHRYQQYQIGPYIYDNDGVGFLTRLPEMSQYSFDNIDAYLGRISHVR